MDTAPIALFGYNRADHLTQTVEHLRRNPLAEKTDVYLFSDGPKNPAAEEGVDAVRRFGRSITGFASVTVVERSENLGLRRSMIAGVSQVAEKHGRVIVVEDDVLTAPSFLRFMNEALDFYESVPTVGSIGGYLPAYITQHCGRHPQETLFHYRPCSWGWATWWDRWRRVDWELPYWRELLLSPDGMAYYSAGGNDMPEMFQWSMDGRNQSWMARWYFDYMTRGMVTVYPVRSLTRNIGFDGTGVHSTIANPSRYARYGIALSPDAEAHFKFSLPVRVEARTHRLMKRFFDVAWYTRDTCLTRLLKPVYRKLRGWCGSPRG